MVDGSIRLGRTLGLRGLLMVWYDMEIKITWPGVRFPPWYVDVFEWHGMVYIGKCKLNMTTVFNKKLILMLGVNTIFFGRA